MVSSSASSEYSTILCKDGQLLSTGVGGASGISGPANYEFKEMTHPYYVSARKKGLVPLSITMGLFWEASVILFGKPHSNEGIAGSSMDFDAFADDGDMEEEDDDLQEQDEGQAGESIYVNVQH